MNPEASNILDAIDFSRITFSIGVLGGVYLFSKIIHVFGDRVESRFPQFRLRVEQLVSLISFLAVVGGIAVAAFLPFRSREAAVTIAGSLGLAFAFGAKDLAASLLSGLVVIFDRTFQVGDRITFGEHYGDVLNIGVRSTRIRTLDDSTVSIPNSQFMSLPVTSANSGALDMQVEIFFFVASRADLRLVERIAREAAACSRYAHLEKPIVVLFKDQIVEQYFCTRVTLKAYVIETIYEKAFETDVTKRVHQAFEEFGVPCPQLGNPTPPRV